MKFAEVQLESNVDQQTYFIKNAKNLTIIPESVKDEGLKETFTEADQQNWTKIELENYLRDSIKERDEIGRIEFAEKKAKYEEKIEVIMQGRKIGLSNSDLSILTGLKEEEIDLL